MNTSKIDLVNTVLIVISLVLACFLPFELFILAYAILGPLHYFTEINWVRDNNYFVKSKSWIYIILAFSLLISLPTILKLPVFEGLDKTPFFQFIKNDFPEIGNSLYFVCILGAGVLLFIKRKKSRLLALAIIVALAVVLQYFSLYHVILGILLPTILHVYVFTILFMWYGSLKSDSKIGYFNVVLAAIVPLIIAFLPIENFNYHFSDMFKTIFVENNFHYLNAHLSGLLGLTDGKSFFFYEAIDLKIQIFIAFAYIYHYLNWFSKTTIIGWHEKLTTKKSILIAILWIVSIALYFIDYRLGLSLVLFFSVLHVLIEFPLNILSVKSIGLSILKKVK